jgi:uncharacterized membrane protein
MATVISQQSRIDFPKQHKHPHPLERDGQIVNVGKAERWVSALAGGVLLFRGLRARSALGSAAMLVGGGSLLYRGATGHCNMYSTLGVNTADTDSFPGLHIEKSITVNCTAAELYKFWRDLTNLPKYMPHIESVTPKDGNVSHWVADAPAGMTLEWDAEIINDKPDELIAWRSLPDSAVNHAGSVHFRALPNNRGTEVRVVMNIGPIAGSIGAAVAKLWHQPERRIEEDLRRFKAIMETGEVASVKGQTTCREKM